MLTQELLKSHMHYDHETGIFTRHRKPKNGGLVAGCKHMTHGGKCYISIKIGSKHFYAHRLAVLYMTGSFPENDTDHIDGDGTNNKWVNLRSVSRMENARNSRIRIDNKSGICGVGWDKSINKWKAQIRVNWKTVFIGNFNNIFDAACARKNAEVRYNFHVNHGDARTL